MKTIDTIEVKSWNQDYREDASSKEVAHPMGLYIEKETEKPSIHLFEIETNYSLAPFHRSVFKICSELANSIDLDKTVMDFNWSYTASGGHTDVQFHEQGKYITGVTFPNSFPVRHPFTSTIERYQKALNTPDKFIDFLSDRHPERYKGSPLYRVIVSLPKHPDRHHIIEPTYDDMEDYKIILVDSERFMSYWIDQEKTIHRCKTMEELKFVYDAQPLKGDDSAFPPFHTGIDEAIKYVSPHIGYPDKTSIATFLKLEQPPQKSEPSWLEKITNTFNKPKEPIPTLEDKISFTNGRHRILNMYILGAPYIPMTISTYENSHIEFEKRFGWKNQTENAL